MLVRFRREVQEVPRALSASRDPIDPTDQAEATRPIARDLIVVVVVGCLGIGVVAGYADVPDLGAGPA